MKCKTCQEQGLTSKVFDQGSTSTLMAFSMFWDEGGVRHVHDPNTHTYLYSCSNGHRWAEPTIYACPAGDYR